MVVRLAPSRLLVLVFSLLAAGFASVACASSALPFPGPIHSTDDSTSGVPNILDEHPLTARPPDNNLLPKLIFFPPNPPPVGVSVNLKEDRDIETGAPEALRPFVTDPFYAPLSTFVSPAVTAYQGGEGLSDEDKSRIARWQKERDKLLAELRETITRLAYASPQLRLREFIALSRNQTPAIAALEKSADELRARLARKAPWNERREWRLAGDAPPTGPGPGMSLELQVMRAAAFYFDGLSMEQRRMLREIAMELEGSMFVPRDSRPTAQLFLYFQPETSRINRPLHLPPDAQRVLRRYIDEKGKIKEELRAAVYAADAGRSNRNLSSVADAQAPLFQELEETAEDLRAALARVPDYARQPYPPVLSSVLVEKIEAYQKAKQELVGLNGRDDDEGLAPLQGDLDALRAAIDLVPGATREEGRAPDAFLTNFLKKRREAVAYYEYDIATLEPGLSPEQRRLLFGGAIARLELPLPGPEEQPTVPPGTLLR